MAISASYNYHELGELSEDRGRNKSVEDAAATDCAVR